MAEETDFETFFPPRGDRPRWPGEVEGRDRDDRLGIVVGGSLSKGLDVKLDRSTMIEGLAVGRYVIVQGQKLRFFSMITDVALDNVNPMIEKAPPDVDDDFLRQVYQGTSTFGRLHVTPMLALEIGETLPVPAEGAEPQPVKTVPGHFAPVYNASEEDVARIFGDETTDKKYYHVGETLDLEAKKIHLDLKRFAERSSGIFGKSGTGKTFLTRLLLAGIIQRDVAVNLVFDMHNEYGWEGGAEGGYRVKGLKQLFGSKVAVFTLDEESSRRRDTPFDLVVRIGYDQIEPEDIEMLREVIGLSEAAIGTVYYLGRLWKRDWLRRLLEMTPDDMRFLVDEHNQHQGTLSALVRRLGFLRRFEFLQEQPVDSSVQRILEYLNKGVNVVLEFGRYGKSLAAYILVANYLTRRIHEKYVERKEKAIGGGEAEPQSLMITIEEAHKFLDPAIAQHTIFGVIARELRKYNVTLLVVDQRPSGIDPEVMSQIGTRVTCLLDNEADIRAVFTGVSGAQALREVLARLDTQQQALILGHAVPMPVVVRTRAYGTAEFYAAIGYKEGETLQESLQENVLLLRGDEALEGID
jgi:DNA helicase HerA-like ATPase